MYSYFLFSISTIFSLLLTTFARDIVFPPLDVVYSQQTPLRVDDSLDEVDIVSGSQFSGLTTFAHLPYVNCFLDEVDISKYDIAFLGAPFDTVRTF